MSGSKETNTKEKIDTKEKERELKPLSLSDELKILAKIAKDSGCL